MVTCEFTVMDGAAEPDESLLDKIRRSVEFAVENEKLGADAELSVALCGDGQIRALNRDFRGKDASTDVLSFPANELTEPLADALKAGLEAETTENGAIFLGDIMISTDTAERQAEEYGNEISEEICFLAVHGTLHLLGYDHIDEDSEAEMREKQRAVRAFRKGEYNGV